MSKPDSLVSCVIPVYKAESYLHQCIDSVLAQDYSHLEVILVNDGSPDRSGVICDAYQALDRRVRVFHQHNQGVSAARNYGVRQALGTYIAFIDADDWVEPSYISSLVGLAENYQAQASVLAQTAHNEANRLSGEEALEEMLYQKLFDTAPWGKLFHRSIPTSIPFPEGMFYEDLAVVCRMISRADFVAVGNGALYHYRTTPDGTMNGHDVGRLLDEQKAARMMYDFVLNTMPNLRRAAACRKFSADCQVLFKLSAEGYSSEKTQLWCAIKQNRLSVVCDSHARLKNRIAALSSYFGKGAMEILWSLHKL